MFPVLSDIKGLSDEVNLSQHQQTISCALEQYIRTHYRSSPNRYMYNVTKGFYKPNKDGS